MSESGTYLQTVRSFTNYCTTKICQDLMVQDYLDLKILEVIEGSMKAPMDSFISSIYEDPPLPISTTVRPEIVEYEIIPEPIIDSNYTNDSNDWDSLWIERKKREILNYNWQSVKELNITSEQFDQLVRYLFTYILTIHE